MDGGEGRGWVDGRMGEQISDWVHEQMDGFLIQGMIEEEVTLSRKCGLPQLRPLEQFSF